MFAIRSNIDNCPKCGRDLSLPRSVQLNNIATHQTFNCLPIRVGDPDPDIRCFQCKANLKVDDQFVVEEKD